jgi:TMEM199 family protein
MVLLTMTAAMVEALEDLQKSQGKGDGKGDVREKHAEPVWIGGQVNEGLEKSTDNDQDSVLKVNKSPTDPFLSNPAVGNPISHGQVLDVARDLKAIRPTSLEALLRGSKVYIPPPPPKSEPVSDINMHAGCHKSELTLSWQTSEYKALMARLRREEEERTYERMTNPPPPMETFAQRFPAASAAHAFSSSYQNINTSDPDDNGLTFADVDRQMALILNVLLSIVACAGAIWVAARWWNTPARLALSMSGSILVGVAEVVVYSGYIRRVGEAKGKEKGVKEVKEIVNTWVVGAREGSQLDDADSISIEPTNLQNAVKARRRLKDTS